MLATIVADIGAELAARRVTVEVRTGRRWLTQRDGAPPRIVFVSLGAEAMPAQQTRARAPGQATGTGTARRLWTRAVQVAAHIWAKGSGGLDDYGACEVLLAQLVQAMQAILSRGSYEYIGEAAPEGDEAVTTNGEVLIARFRIFIPITDAAWTNAPGVTPDITDEIEITG